MAEKLKIISLGGLNEIGKNVTVYEYGGDIIVVDVGMGFPDDDMYGIDVVIPDFSYLIKNKDKNRGIFLTHGHEDHIGSIPYLLRDVGSFYKEYWGEGSNRARNWQRYDMGGNKTKLAFEEGVDSYIPYAGKLKDNLSITIEKIKSTMCNCGSITIEELHKNARLTIVSAVSIREGGAHDVITKDIE